ncbi:(Fe-S)-binding protein [Macrococcus sp. EM39E]|uniref:(Fe-S)-binding protein n=1 Tax=Macrococcus animalis TaxID=3395467 RepID=UPI0039BDB4B0
MNNLSLAYDKTFSCVQCGMCLPSCPTYLTLKEEKHSPRGRINLLKYYAEKNLSLEDIREGFEVCLGCMACQTVCPTGVDYGYIHHTAVEMLKEKEKKKNPVKYYSLKYTLSNSLNKKVSLKIMKKSLYSVQNVMNKESKVLNIIGQKNKTFYQSLPTINKSNVNTRSPNYKDEKSKSLKVVYFKGCVMDVMFEKINDRAIEILERHNIEVITLPNEICCGALQNHAGYSEDAKQLAIKNIEMFEKIECDYIVNAIGGCGATLKEYPLYFSDEPGMQIRAKTFSDKNVDISVLLAQLELKLTKSLNYDVTYQPSCHLTNVQKVTKQPETIIKKIPGINFTTLKEKDICCGSAGIYNIVQYENAMKVLDRKMGYVKETRANVIVTSNPGCYLQMQVGIMREGLSEIVEVKHIVDLVYESCVEGK